MKKEEINMVYTSEMPLPKKSSDKSFVFLAGSMGKDEHGTWRERIMSDLSGKFLFLDPTCHNHASLDADGMKKHIQWELDAMEMADTILLHFLPESESPISLVELGLYTFTDKLIVVCPKEFYKYNYLYVLCEKYNTPFLEDIEAAKPYLLNR
ncbi:MAG: hypothetical protein Crog4KO_08280 [Crocinitomicaceae bacterium]